MREFKENNGELLSLLQEWVPKLLSIPDEIREKRINKQNRSIQQIVGHMVDSVSNNTHRIIHLQYQTTPISFPDYANLGNNDRWIAIQNYQEENWHNLVQLWKYTNLHFIHLVEQINIEKLDHVWISALNQQVTLREMVLDYLRHFKLHLNEIDELIGN
jgi:hypothetical protein